MENQEWQKYKEAYHLRSLKYAGGQKLQFSRKHEGIAEYLQLAAAKLGQDSFSFLDAGCGNGIYLNFMSDKYPEAKLFGFDFSDTIIPIARKNAPNTEINQGNLEKLTCADASFDLILCTQVIEHLLDDKKGLAELYRILKPGGYLIISTDNENNLFTKILNFPIFLLSLPYHLIKKILPNKKYFPHRSYTIKQFTDLINTQPFITEDLSTFRFSAPWPFYKISLFVKLINKLEKYCINKNLFANSGDIVVTLCKKTNLYGDYN
jgi:ubiquinone/menaquinone biosynthesis C-methylase UbiE